jgi:hypothetical protein
MRYLHFLPLVVALSIPSPLAAVDSAAVKPLFANPPREFASAPLWVWNDRLTEDQIRGTLRDLASQKVRQVFVHPRPGLMTPYLGPEWFTLWKVALDEAEKLDLNVWIYDENSYPSGFAGGWVPELMPESRGMGLSLRVEKTLPPKASTNHLAVFRLEGNRAEDVTAKLKAGTMLVEGEFLVARIDRAGNSPWHGNRCYVNLLTPGVTEKFLDVTLGAYEREIGSAFGKRVPGVFTDEPNIRPVGGFPWCPDLPQQFQKRWDYGLIESLPSLSREIGDWRRVRHNYYSTLNTLFIERWAKPFYERCDKLGLEFTGHYWDHEWPHCVGVPDNMAMAAWQHRPGIDTLMNQYAENTHAQFGNVRFCREVSSVANQLGRKRTLVELYGAGGWDLRLEDMKRIGDWLQVLGVNTLDEHLSYITLRGARKRDHPQSFSYHEPWWDSYHVVASYFTRLSCALSQGQQVNRVLVLEPTTTAWMHQGNDAKLGELGNAFFQLLMGLESRQVEYDLACEDVLARHGTVEGKELRVGQRRYPVFVLPPFTENLDGPTVKLVDGLLKAGGTVVCLGDPPLREEGSFTSGLKDMEKRSGWVTLNGDTEEAVADLAGRVPAAGFVIEREVEDRGILFHHRRELDDGQILFLVNTSLESPSAGRIRSDLKGLEQWNPYTGQAEPYPFERTDQGVRADFRLPPSGSLLLFLSRATLEPPKPPGRDTGAGIVLAGSMEVKRLEPNVLTLDFADVAAGGEARSNLYFYAANQFVWQKNGMDRNPWDSAVQFKDELITRTFAPTSGFTAHYRFTIEGPVPANLTIVIERPDLYTIACNGQPVTAPAGQWWLDHAFGRIPLSAVARTGENVVTLQAQPFTILHELEPAYVLGDFTLKASTKGWVIAPDQPLRLVTQEVRTTHGNRPDGAMWLSGGVGYGKDAQGRTIEDRAPFVVFDLGQTADVAAIRVWNYNENDVRDLTGRGAERIHVTASTGTQPGEFDQDLGTFELKRAPGRAADPEVFPVNGRFLRCVRFEILANHHGVSYPVSGEPADHGFVGLAEVQFFRALRFSGFDPKLATVRIQSASSGLAVHQRTPERLVDGSGLSSMTRSGWNEQGHPFYAHGVAYRRSFPTDKVEGRYFLTIPSWYGSVAKVNVNGRWAGTLVSPPWECEVTRQLAPGTNTIEVVVVGTLKNTLGPHHGGHALGSAWPGMFQSGPKEGPPPGVEYSTVGYGLFEPFELRQVPTP